MKRQGKQYKALRIITKAANTTEDEAVSGQKRKHKGKKPASKSRDKAKGAYKLKSSDVALNHRLESWSVATGEHVRWSKDFNGEGYDDDDDDREEEYGHGDVLHGPIVVQEAERSIRGTNGEEGSIDEEKDFEGEGCDEDEDREEQEYSYGDGLHESAIVQEMKEKCTHGTDDDDEENMGFYEVGFIWEDVDDEGWCVVDEM